jgi:hypothetical protein
MRDGSGKTSHTRQNMSGGNRAAFFLPPQARPCSTATIENTSERNNQINAIAFMPYIKKERRDAILSGAEPQDAGELNFAITITVDKYLENKGDLRYAHLNEAVGALECAKLELYRRVAVPYEDEKIKQSGDVYRSNKGMGRAPTPGTQ